MAGMVKTDYKSLSDAIDQGDLASVIMLLDAKASPNAESPLGRRVLNVAVEAKKLDPDLIKTLIFYKAAPNNDFEISETPLSAVLLRIKDDPDYIALHALLNAKADMGKKGFCSNATPLELAAKSADQTVMQFFRDRAAQDAASNLVNVCGFTEKEAQKAVEKVIQSDKDIDPAKIFGLACKF